LNNQKPANFKRFNKHIDLFKSFILNRNLDIDEYCVTASSTLSAYGLREGEDIDYLHHNADKLSIPLNLINSHNEHGEGKYHLNKSDIIFDPKNYFYHKDIKFATLEVVKKLKEKRGEIKDIKDIKYINSVI
jgi:hypothetical protein